jgi:hypothetical protein
MHNRSKTKNDNFNYDCEIKLSKKQIRKINSNIQIIFNKYILPEDRRIRYVEKLNSKDSYIFSSPNRSIYIIQADNFKEQFKGPMIKSVIPEDLEIGLIYMIKNSNIGSTLLEYKKKLIDKEILIFEDMNGIKFSLNSEDIINKILPESIEYNIIMSGNYFDA